MISRDRYLRVRRSGRERRMWREKGRDGTRTGRGAERNVLRPDRQEDMAILTVSFPIGRCIIVRENIQSRETLDQGA